MTPAAEIIKRLTAVFGEPKTNDPALFLEEFEKAMRGYSRDALLAACERVIKTNKFWPRPAELLEHVAFRGTSHPDFIDPPVPDGYTPATAESRARVQALVSDLVSRLAEKGADADNLHWKDVSRPDFKKMQRESPNPHLHRRLP